MELDSEVGQIITLNYTMFRLKLSPKSISLNLSNTLNYTMFRLKQLLDEVYNEAFKIFKLHYV